MTEKKQAPRPRRPEGGFRLKSFPKEFEKGLFDNFDRTYYGILIISFVVFMPLFMVMANNASEWFGLSEDELAQRKEKIIRKLYQVDLKEDEVEQPEEKPEEEKTDEQVEQEAQEQRKEEIQKRKEAPKEKQGLSVAERRAQREKIKAARAERRAAEEAAVSSSGSLALLTGGESASGESVRDILADASSSNVDLDKALSKVDGLATGANGKGKPGSGLSGRGTKGGRVEGGDLGEVGGIGGATSESLGSRKGGISFGDVAVSGEARGEKSRSESEIQKVINKAMPAIEQCFKKQQRLNPSLSGAIRVKFTITKRGSISDVRVISDTVGDSKVQRCVKQRLSRLRGFGRAKADITVNNVVFTFN